MTGRIEVSFASFEAPEAATGRIEIAWAAFETPDAVTSSGGGGGGYGGRKRRRAAGLTPLSSIRKLSDLDELIEEIEEESEEAERLIEAAGVEAMPFDQALETLRELMARNPQAFDPFDMDEDDAEAMLLLL